MPDTPFEIAGFQSFLDRWKRRLWTGAAFQVVATMPNGFPATSENWQHPTQRQTQDFDIRL